MFLNIIILYLVAIWYGILEIRGPVLTKSLLPGIEILEPTAIETFMNHSAIFPYSNI